MRDFYDIIIILVQWCHELELFIETKTFVIIITVQFLYCRCANIFVRHFTTISRHQYNIN